MAGFDADTLGRRIADLATIRMPDEPLECPGEDNILSLDGDRHMRYRRALHTCLSRPAVQQHTTEIIVAARSLPSGSRPVIRTTRCARQRLQLAVLGPVIIDQIAW